MPDTTSESTLSELKGKTLTGWEEIRPALVVVDSLPADQRNGVRVDAYEHSEESSVKVSFRNQLLKGNDNPSSKILDVLSVDY